MNKKLQQYAAAHGLTCEKNSCYGVFNGYQVSFHLPNAGGAAFLVGAPLYSASTPCLIGVHVHAAGKNNEIINFLTVTHKKELQLANCMVDSSGFYVYFKNNMGFLKKIDRFLNAFTEFLKSIGIDGTACPYCGYEMTGYIQVVDQNCKFNAHEYCFNERYNAVLQSEAVENEQPNHYFKGFLGALIGSLAGCAVFAILYIIGYLASISSLVGAVLASLLYSKLGGKNNKIKIVIVSVTVTLMILLTFFLCYIFTVTAVMVRENLIGNPVEVLFRLIRENEEIRRAIIADFVLTIIFTIIGIAVNIYTMIRQQKKLSSGMKKV